MIIDGFSVISIHRRLKIFLMLEHDFNVEKCFQIKYLSRSGRNAVAIDVFVFIMCFCCLKIFKLKNMRDCVKPAETNTPQAAPPN